MNKAKILEFVKKYVNQNNLQFIILLIPLVFLFSKQVAEGDFKIDDFLDTTILVSFALAILCEIIAKIIVNIVMVKCEDASKLIEDYDKLNKKYCKEPLIEYKNTKFPVICMHLCKEAEECFEIEIDDSKAQERYSLPGQIADRSDWLMKAHEKSVIFNNLNIRLNDVQREKRQ